MIKASKKSPLSLIRKRLALPVSILIGVMMLGVIGLLLIPGQDPSGNEFHLSFLDALYIVSYTATTIGYGEIPHPFTDGQRLWMLFVIYTSVVAWLYNIGSILRIFQDKALWEEIHEYFFELKVSRLKTDFYVVLGYGRTGEWVTRVLDSHGTRVVVLESNRERFEAIGIKKSKQDIISLKTDYALIKNIKKAGVLNDYCKGVFIVGRQPDKNKKALVICNAFGVKTIVKADNKQQEGEYSLSGATNVLNLEKLSLLPIYNIFRRRSLFILASILDKEIFDSKTDIKLPDMGKWIVFGKSEFSNRVTEILLKVGNQVITIEELNRESFSKIEYDVNGIVALGSDIENITFINECRKKLQNPFTVAVNKKYTLSELYDQISIDLLIKPWLLFVENAFSLISEPLIREMLIHLSSQPEGVTNVIVSKIADIYIDNEEHATTWSKIINDGISVSDLEKSLGGSKDNVIIYSKNNKENIDRNMLDRGDIVLISSRNRSN